jgi:hypothetical protein
MSENGGVSVAGHKADEIFVENGRLRGIPIVEYLSSKK